MGKRKENSGPPLILSQTHEAIKEISTIWTRICAREESGISSIAITSAVSGEGKTFIAMNLAKSVAANGADRVILISGDFWKDDIAAALGLNKTAGFSDLLLDANLSVEETVVPTSTDGLFFLPAGQRDPGIFSKSHRARLVAILAKCKSRFDLVLCDLPSVMEIPNLTPMAGLFDGVVLVVAANETAREDIDRAILEVARFEGKILGTVLNKQINHIPQGRPGNFI